MIETNWFEDHGVDEPPRLTVLPWLLWLLVIVLSISAALYSGRVVSAEPVIARSGMDYVRLTDAICTPNLPGYKSGNAVLDGVSYKLCWKLVQPATGPLHVVIVYEDGDVWRADPKKFGPESKNQPGL